MLTDKVGKRCCACRACQQVCTANAIFFENDDFGFEYPNINTDKCLSCGKCEHICPIINFDDKKADIPKPELCGAARAKDMSVRKGGSSGGMFGLFAEKVIKDGGTVFGAAFDENLKLKTVEADSVSKLSPLLKSKYLLCDTGNAFSSIKNAADAGKSVLYCSSPCQIAAFKRYLGKEYDNILTVDFICHGVGNQEMFNKSINWFEKKYGKELSGFMFRFKDKRKATSHYYKAQFSDGSERAGMYFDFPYYNAYCKELAYRDICYVCPFASNQRVSDITIGDFHTIEKYVKDIDRMAGISMLICNTEKGREFVEALKDELDIREMPSEVLYRNNRFSCAAVGTGSAAEEFRNAFSKYGYDGETYKMLNPMSDNLKKAFYKLPKPIKKLFKLILEH